MTTSKVAATANRAARSPGLVLALLGTAQLMLVLDVTVVNVALPDIGADLGLSRGALPWVLSVYTVLFGGLMLAGGRLADRIGPRRAVLAGLAAFTASSVLCGLSQGQGELLAGRAFQGASAAVLSPAALAVVLTALPAGQHKRAFAVWSGLAGAGMALGVVVGGVLTTAASWRWVFGINVPIGLALLALVPVVVPRRAGRGTRGGEPLDLRGAVLVTAATTSGIYGLVRAGTDGWDSTVVWLALVAASLLAGGFVVAERATEQPLLRPGLLRRRPVAAGAFLMLTATGLLVGAFFLGSFALQRAHGYSALRTGLLFLPVAAATVLGSHLAGDLLGRVSARTVAPAGFALAAAGYATAAWSDGTAALVTGLTVSAAGIGALFVTAFTASLSDVDPAESGLRSALVNTFHELGGAAGVAALSTTAGAVLVAVHPAPADFTRPFAFAATAAAACAAVAAVIVPATLRPAGSPRPAH